MLERLYSAPLKLRVSRPQGTREGGGRGRPGFCPLPPLTCLAKNLLSSLRLFSFLAASKRSGAAATSRKRCSMTADPPPPAAIRVPYLALGAPEQPRSRAGGVGNYAPREISPGCPANTGKTQHTWGSTRRSASSALDQDRHGGAAPAPPPQQRKQRESLPPQFREGI